MCSNGAMACGLIAVQTVYSTWQLQPEIKHTGKGGMGRLHPSLQCGSLVDPEPARGKGRSLSPACLLRTEAVTMSRFPALDYD